MAEARATKRLPLADSKWDRESWDMVLRGDPSGWMRRHAQLVDADEIEGAVEDLVGRRGQRGAPDTINAYTHFSYCRKTCSFCMYWHQVPSRREQYDEYAAHLAGLCNRFGALTGPIEVSNAYFGGGTPSAMPVAGLEHFLGAFSKNFRVGREFTTEAHPTTLDGAKLSAFIGAGINRFSMGLQSLDPEVLEQITRSNRPRDELAGLVRGAQSERAIINLDLCLGLPRQTLESVRKDLRDVLGFGPDIITVYRFHAVPSLPIPAPEGMNYDALFDDAMRADIEAAGYDLEYDAKRFTAKLFSRDRASIERTHAIESGARSQHRGEARGSFGYAQFSWEPSSIIGMGPGAYMHLYGRFWVREVTRLDNLGDGSKPVYWGARLTLEDEIRIAVLQNLHRNKIIEIDALESFSGVDIRDMFGDLLREMAADDVIEWIDSSSFRVRPHVDASGLRRFAERIVPAIPPPRGLSTHQRERVQPQLVIDPDRGRGRGPERTSMVGPWRELLGIPGVGKRFLSARVELMDERSVFFACGAAGTTPLRVFVYAPGEHGFFSRSEHFALSYGSRKVQPLTEREKRFLEALALRTQELDPRT
ncbi:MAG: radical SAM protein [Myxococcota bacterium]